MIYVCPLSAVGDVIDAAAPSHMVSLLDPETMISTPAEIAADKHLQLGVNDIARHDPDLVPPAHDHIEALLNFVDSWTTEAPILIHCWAGISRSTAAALITQCQLNQSASEAGLAAVMRAAAPHAHPNRLMIKIADELMGRNGRLIDAVEQMGPGQITWEGEVFSVPVYPEV